MLRPRPFSPEEIKSILRCLAEAGTVIVGGQAVNLWSLLYEQPAAEPWRSSRPYTSFDVDALADRGQLGGLARALQQAGFRVKVALPRTDAERALNTGLVTACRRRQQVTIHLLGQLLGLSPQDIVGNAAIISWSGVEVRLLHPVMCVESKTLNLLRLAQDDPAEPRQDRKHLELSIANLREYLIARSASGHAPQSLHIARRLVDFAYLQAGREVRQRHGIDVLAGIPWTRWRVDGKAVLRDFASEEPVFRAEIQARDQAEAEVQAWLDRLQPRRRKR